MTCRFAHFRRFALVAFMASSPALAQLRVVNYNVAALNGDLTRLDEVFQALNVDDKPGFAVAPHVYMFQEVQNADSTALLTRLNNVAPPGVVYARATYTTSGTEDGASGAQALYYRTDVLQEDTSGHIDIATGASRNSDRWLLRLVGYTSPQARFYAYSSHLKASNTTADANERTAGAQAIRATADALGAGVHIIYAGDWNIYNNTEGAYLAFLAAGNGQSIDPLGTGSWSGSGNAIKHTQSPCGAGCSLVTGGMDDRFDHQHATSAFNDAEGLSRIAGTYRTFGNDGQHYNVAINVGNNSYYPGDIPRSNALAAALSLASDHCPVVCEYQIPAWMNAILTPSFGRIIQDAAGVSVQLVVSNDAEAIVQSGADELDFSAAGSGVLSGVQSGIVLATAPPALRDFAVNTSTVGAVGGSLLVTTASQGAQNSSITVNTSGTVVRHANASFESASDVNSRTIPQEFDADSGVQALSVEVHNFGFDALQALLDIDSVSGVAAPLSFVGGLASSIAAAPATLSFEFDTAGTGDDTFTIPVTIHVSDENLLGATAATLSLTFEITTHGGIAGDINGDCVVNLTDLSMLLGAFGTCDGDAAYNAAADLDANDCVNLSDLSMLLANFGSGC